MYWGHHLAIAAAYTGIYDILRTITVAQFVVTAGLRIACLLLVPRKYWTALLLGEALPVIAMAATTVDRFGPAFGLISSFPPIVLCMLIVAWFTRNTSLKRPDGTIDINRLLLVSIACALASAADTCLSVLAPRAPDGGALYHISVGQALRSVQGYYLGALAIAPAFFALRERLRALTTPLQWQHIRTSGLFKDVLFIQVPLLTFILFYAYMAGGGALAYGRMAAVVPILILGARHHWHGAAVAGMLSSAALMCTSSSFQDPSLDPAQTAMAFTLTICLVFGSVKVLRSTNTSEFINLLLKHRM